MPEDSHIYRTVPIKLEISNQAEKTLRRTIDQFLPAINYVIDTAWDPEDEQFRTSNGYKLHEETYHEIRDRSALPADLVQNARKEAVRRHD